MFKRGTKKKSRATKSRGPPFSNALSSSSSEEELSTDQDRDGGIRNLPDSEEKSYSTIGSRRSDPKIQQQEVCGSQQQPFSVSDDQDESTPTTEDAETPTEEVLRKLPSADVEYDLQMTDIWQYDDSIECVLGGV